jgi:uncharacterized protein (TIGR02145 family)
MILILILMICMKSHLKLIITIVLPATLLLMLLSCRKVTPPILLTAAVSDITALSAVSGYEILNDGGSELGKCGICWSTHHNPTTDDSKAYVRPGRDTFALAITDLTANTTYYVRAFAFYNDGISYGNEISFVTSQILVLPPTVITTGIRLYETYMIADLKIISDGGGIICLRGICWSTSSNPTIDDDKTIDNTPFDSFGSVIRTGLKLNTTYYFRAYAVNNAGIGYGNELAFTLWLNSLGPNVTDADGNIYKSVKIGTQIWMAENLRTTRLNDGESVSVITDNIEWDTVSGPAYCWYDNDELTYKSSYGALYNMYSVRSGKLCPVGWHIPDSTEWTVLRSYLGYFIAGGKIKETGTSHWNNPNVASNESGFTALPGGIRYYWPDEKTSFRDIGFLGCWWGYADSSENIYTQLTLYNGFYNFNLDGFKNARGLGMSVRCISD